MLHCLIQESVSPLRGFSAGSAARLSSSSLAPSLCWWFVWPDTSADGGEAGWDTSPLPQHAYKHTHLSTRDCIFHIYCIERKHVEKTGVEWCSELKWNHQLQHGQRPLNHGEASWWDWLRLLCPETISLNKLRGAGNQTHQLKASNLGAKVHVFRNKSWICHSLIP